MKLKLTQLCLALSALALVHGCGNTPPVNDAAAPGPGKSTIAPNSAEPAADSTPKELVKPAAGKGNVQGKVLFNDKPAANIEVNLSEKFSTFLGASGKSYTARTDKNGDYVIKNVPPKEYEGLTARVFNTDTVVFIKSGILQSKKYTVESGKTLFVEPTHLFKSDLKILSPKAAAAMPAKQATFKWQTYPDAAYYKISIYSDDLKNSSGIFQERVDGTSYQPAKPLTAGGYRIVLEAYNSSDHKLSQGPDQYKFRIAP